MQNMNRNTIRCERWLGRGEMVQAKQEIISLTWLHVDVEIVFNKLRKLILFARREVGNFGPGKFKCSWDTGLF